MGQRTAGRRTRGYATVLFLFLTVLPPTPAKERLVRSYDFASGLDASMISAITQDPRGFLWIGTDRYVYRFDGLEFVAWNEEPLPRHPELVVHDPLEGLLLLHVRTVMRFEKRRLVPWIPEVEPALQQVRSLLVDAEGTLWMVDDLGVRARDRSGRWTTWPADSFGGARVRHVHRSVVAGAFVSTRNRLWRMSLDAAPEVVFETKRKPYVVRGADQAADGRVFVIEDRANGGRQVLVEIRDGEPIDRVERNGLGLDLLVRGEAVWMMLDFSLTRWHPLDGAETFHPGESFLRGAGRMFLDNEDNLWIGGRRLVQLPEPSAAAWIRKDGLPFANVEHLQRARDGLYTTHYGGLGFIPTDGSGSARTLYEGFAPGRGCLDADERFWQVQPRPIIGEDLKIVEAQDGRLTEHEFPGSVTGPSAPCSPAADGTVWITRGTTVYRTRRGGGRPDPVLTLAETGERYHSLLEVSNGDLWASSETHTCRLARVDVERRNGEAWDCQAWDLRAIKQVFETPGGDIWISALNGMSRWDRDGWRPIDGLPVGAVYFASPSPRGGVWVPSSSGFLRVEEHGSDNGYFVEVVERLGVNAGLMTKTGGNVHEDADGTLWLSTRFGVQRIPASVRDAPPRIPTVEFVRFEAGNETLALDEPGYTLRSSQNDVVLGFAAPTFKDRTGLRYRVRVHDRDAWFETQTAELRFVGLAPGRYRAQVAASLDGENWSETPALLAFTILPPWYLTSWAIALFIVLGSAILYGIYRARVEVLLRFERQRARIAMDLHDEMGSRLGSIRVLSDLLKDDSIEAAARPSIVDQIADSAEELSSSLADIVWSLRPRARTLRAVIERLEVRANQFVPQGRVEVDVVDGIDDVVVSLAVCKNLLSLGSEALHNAVRHGGANRLRIRLDRSAGREFELRVEDNGAGFDATANSEDGLGLDSMRIRAEEIGGKLTIDSAPGRGTTVTVRFAPREYRR